MTRRPAEFNDFPETLQERAPFGPYRCVVAKLLLAPSLQSMKRRMFSPAHHDKVLNRIVRDASIYVMHNFIRTKQPSEMLLHHDPMLTNVSIAARGLGMIRHVKMPVALRVDIDAASVVRGYATAHRVCSARMRTELGSSLSDFVRPCLKRDAALFALTLDTPAAPVGVTTTCHPERGILVGHRDSSSRCRAGGCRKQRAGSLRSLANFITVAAT